MFDKNLLFSNAQVVNADADSTNVLTINKTPADGIDIELAVTAASGTTPTLDTIVVDASGRTVAHFPQLTGTGAKALRVQANSTTLKLTYDVGGSSPSFTVTAGITTGKDQPNIV